MNTYQETPLADSDLIDQIMEEQHRAEIEINGCILADPATGVVVAMEEGIEPGDFCDDGLTIIFAAGVLSQRLGRLIGQKSEDALRVARLAKCGLIQSGFWREHYACIRPPYFSDESLGEFMHTWPSAAMTRQYCRQLNEINRRIKDAREHIRFARQLLSGEAA